MDGVLTDGSVTLMPGGEQVRVMNIKDGYALQLAVKKGYGVLIISGGSSGAVRERLMRLGVKDVYMEVQDKVDIINKYISKISTDWNKILYMGDDMPDHKAMQMCGLPCCPIDAVSEIKAISVYVSAMKGGDGCVRDVIEKVLKLNNNWD